MELHSQNTFKQSQAGLIVGKVQNQLAVHVMLNVIPLGNDHNIIPVVELEKRFELRFLDKLVGNLFSIRFPRRFFTR